MFTSKKVLSIILVFGILFGIMPFGVTGVSAAGATLREGVMFLEAESATVNSVFTIESGDSAASNYGHIYTKSNSYTSTPPTSAAGEVEFTYTAQTSGTQYVWARINPTTLNKMLWISVNGGAYSSCAIKGIVNEYSWIRLGSGNATKGNTVKVKICSRVAYFAIDCFAISTNSAYTPTDASLKLLSFDEYSYTMTGTTDMMQAENATMTSAFSVRTVSGAAGSKTAFTSSAVGSQPSMETAGDLSFNIYAPQTATYYIWARVLPTSTTKSAWVSINRSNYISVTFAGTANEWQWACLGYTRVAAGGRMYVRMIPKNGYFDVDEILVTNEKYKKPSDINGTLVDSLNTSVPMTGSYPAPPVSPTKGEHPRLYFTKSDIPTILANASKEQNKAAWQQYNADLATDIDGILPVPATGASNMNNQWLGIIEAYAFNYATEGNKTYGRKAIDAVLNYADSLVLTGHFNDGYTRNGGQTVFTMAVVYDWCYDLLTEEEKKMFTAEAQRIYTDGVEVGWPPVSQGGLTGHGSEAQLMRDLVAYGIACYDERPDVYNVTAGRFFAEYWPNRVFHYQGGFFHQGTGYGSYRGQWDFNSTWMYDALGAKNIYGDDQLETAYYFLYMRRPDGLVLTDGDHDLNGQTIGAYHSGYMRTYMLAANYFGDPYLKDAFYRSSNNYTSFGYGHSAMTPVEYLIFNNPDLAPGDLNDLPLTKYFDYPAGYMIARTGWDTNNVNSDDVVCEMKMGTLWFANHHHTDFGHFQLYYKGLLTGDSGRYDGYGNAHDGMYYKRSIAHNTMLIANPDSPSQSTTLGYTTQNGSQRAAYGGREMSKYQQLIDNGYNYGKILGHEFGPDEMKPEYNYLKGDLTGAYVSTETTDYQRSFMFYNLESTTSPAALIVFDRVALAKATNDTTWLLHVKGQPQISGSRTVVKNTENGYNGRLTVDTLLPESTNITYNGGTNTFLVNGVNYPGSAVLDSSKSHDSDGWRLEISPKTDSSVQYFLNVLQVGDASSNASFTPEKVETNTHIGVKIADKLALFSKSGKRLQSSVTFTLASDADATICDLSAGKWTLKKSGETQAYINVTADGGVAHFTAPAGTYELVYTDAASGELILDVGEIEYNELLKEFTVNVYSEYDNTELSLAVYNEKGNLISLEKAKYTGEGRYIFSADLGRSLTGCSAKVMAWSGDVKARPVARHKSIRL